MTRVAVDVRLAMTGGGIATYIDSILPEIDRTLRASSSELITYGSHRVNPYPFGSYRRLAARFVAYYTWLLPRALVRDKVDGLLALSAFSPIPTACKTVAVIYDVYALRYRQIFGAQLALSWRGLLNQLRARAQLYAANGADAIVALSEITARDVCEFSPGAAGRCRVIYPDVSAHFCEAPAVLRDRFILYVGAFNEQKNVEALLRAHTELVRSFKLSIPLVLVGHATWPEVDVARLVRDVGVPSLTTVLGRVSRESLVDLYRRCGLFIYLSAYEGFGLPVLEAIRCGAPVLVNDASSLREIVPIAECRVNASDARATAARMARLLESDFAPTARTLHEHAQKFSASCAAREMLALLE